MSTGMTSEDGMFSVNEVPWHRLGTVLDGYPSRQEAMEASGLDWEVQESRIGTMDPRGWGWDSELVGWKALSRSDTGTVFHVAKMTYPVIQNQVGFELLEALLEDQAVRLETGGSYGGGAHCYVSARIDEEFFVDGDPDHYWPFAVVNWSHDGSASLHGRVTNVRPVCYNTVSAGEAEGSRTGRQFSIRHSAKWQDRVTEAKALLVGARDGAKAFQAMANELAAIPVDDAQRKLFINLFIPAPIGLVFSDQVMDNIQTERRKVSAIFDSRTVPDEHRHTAYGWLLAGGEYLDHKKGYRNADTLTKRTLLSHSAFKAKMVPMIRDLVGAR